MAGTNVWWGHAEAALLRLAEALRIPVLMNGMARGTAPADHELAFSRARSKALKEADIALVVGVPMDFRLGFGGVFGADTELIAVDRVAPDRPHPRAVAAGLYGDLTTTLTALAAAGSVDHEQWIGELRAVETAARAAEQAELADDRTPLHPMRVYAELARCSTATRSSSSTPATSARTPAGSSTATCPARGWTADRSAVLALVPAMRWRPSWPDPDRQVVLLQGDGAFGFSGMEWDTLVRHGVHVVSVIGNNGIWALENHPMDDALRLLGGRRAAARHPLRRSRHRARRARRTGVDAGRVATRAGARFHRGSARGGEYADRSHGGLPASLESRLTTAKFTGRVRHWRSFWIQWRCDFMSPSTSSASSRSRCIDATRSPTPSS